MDDDRQGVEDISINSIRPNPFQPRKDFDEENKELAASIQEHG